MLASYSFRNKPQIQRLLTYLIEHAFDSSDTAFDQRAIAMDCLGRCGDFDPAENPVVRIEVGRLRKLLNSFYSDEFDRDIKITIPLGQYRPVIERNTSQHQRSNIPELEISPARPECLSLLLQFETDEAECPELYLLRHQIRIGLTVYIGKLQGVRLVVALPDQQGNIKSHVDFIVKISVDHHQGDYQLQYNVLDKTKTVQLSHEQFDLPKAYIDQDLDALIGCWGTGLLDREIGLLWSEWVRLRDRRLEAHSTRVQAIVSFQRYLQDDSFSNFHAAFTLLSQAQREDSDDNVLNAALSELYYRNVINGFDVNESIVNIGLEQVRQSLRINPSCSRLHLLLAFMMFFSKEYHMAKIELELCADKPIGTFSFKFHMLVLKCLMSGLNEGLDELEALCADADFYPKLYVAMIFLQALLAEDSVKASMVANHWGAESLLPMVQQCFSHLILPSQWSDDQSRERLQKLVVQYLPQV